jgi:hypothetical protein
MVVGSEQQRIIGHIPSRGIHFDEPTVQRQP